MWCCFHGATAPSTICRGRSVEHAIDAFAMDCNRAAVGTKPGEHRVTDVPLPHVSRRIVFPL
jgi:hypothetical protein